MAVYKKPILLILASFFMYSCAPVDSALKRGSQPSVYYVGTPDLKLYPGASFSQKCLAKLPLNEKVIRYKLKNGFAYVSVTSSGQQGWVNNAHLKWKPVSPVDTTKSPPFQRTLTAGCARCW